MAKHIAKAFGPNETVVVDGQAYVDCEFKNVLIVFEGGVLPTFAGCHFEDCKWRMEGAAERTLSYLRFLYTSGNKRLVQDILRNISGQMK